MATDFDAPVTLAERLEKDDLPSVSRLRGRPIAAFIRHGSIWEIGWNGTWVRCWKGPAPAGESKTPPGTEPRGV